MATPFFPGTGGAATPPRYSGRAYVIARANGVGRVLMICDKDDAGSRTVIEACGWLGSSRSPGRAGHPHTPVLDRLNYSGTRCTG